jgi:predicted permease
VLLAPSTGIVTIVVGLALCAGVARLLPLDDKQRRTFAFAAGIYNYSYIPVPLVQKFFSRETMGMLFTYNLGVEIAFWTAGIFILTHHSVRSSGWKRLLNGPVIAIIVSLILNFCHAHEWLPSFFLTSVHMVGQSSVPLSLILTGATLADLLLQNHAHTPGITAIGGCGVRLLILPVLFLLIARFLPCSVELKRVIVVQAAMPAAMFPIILAKHYGGDPDTAMQIVLSTTLAGLLTIPLWIQWGMRFAGI